MKKGKISKLIFGCMVYASVLSFSGQTGVAQDLPRAATPKTMVKAMDNYLKDVENSKQDLHSIMVLQHGKVIAAKWMGEGDENKPHVLNSVSKTFTATAIGFAVAEGKLKVTDKVISFFPDKLPAEISPNLKNMEIRHLLTMSCGHDADPTGLVRKQEGTDWVQGFLAIPVVHEPGTFFVYNSLGTYMLSAIVQKVTGQKVIDYLTPRLFQPLRITGASWTESPQGINCGGWGLYLKTEDLAKMGQLFLQKGKWNGKQLLPESWIEEATTSKIASLPSGMRPENLTMKPQDSDWLQGYGYQMWRCRHNGFRADGAAGQYIIVLPEKDAVIVTTANINDMQAEINLIWKHILPAL
ncbi:class C beta-lactamase-related serine hydrolase [Parabacteroides sp. AF48-14]|nr:class C beta-lactamase-related serine hydrolase [Parabacteroides sp. AF48-14]